MPKPLTQYRIFIGSPAGLEEERKLFRIKLEKYTALHAEPRGITFYPAGWEDTTSGAGRPQELINEDLRQCDHAVFVLHDRWGSPTGGGYSSGTEEEWALAEQLYTETKIRNIALFFKQVASPQMHDPGHQLRKVIAFRQQIEKEKKYLFKSYVAVGEFGELLEAMMPAIERTTAQFGRPSYYETLLALAFAYFARCAVDVAVIEVGVGGLLDGTNVLMPAVAAITNVGLDHTELLGETVEEIASDKAGIAKASVPLVSDATGPARAIIEQRCAQVGAPFFSVRDRVRIVPAYGAPYGQTFSLETPIGSYALDLPVLGAFQQRNAATAVTVLEVAPPELRPSPAQIARGLAQLVVPGRMEFFPGHPSVVFDIAHNADKARNLADALRAEFLERRFTFVVAIGESKDAAGVLAPFFELPASFVFTSFEAAGRVPTRPQRLASLAQERGFSARAIADPLEALSVARRTSDPGSVVVVTGSTFIVATLRDWWLSNVGERAAR